MMTVFTIADLKAHFKEKEAEINQLVLTKGTGSVIIPHDQNLYFSVASNTQVVEVRSHNPLSPTHTTYLIIPIDKVGVDPTSYLLREFFIWIWSNHIPKQLYKVDEWEKLRTIFNQHQPDIILNEWPIGHDEHKGIVGVIIDLITTTTKLDYFEYHVNW